MVSMGTIDFIVFIVVFIEHVLYNLTQKEGLKMMKTVKHI
jgi:hypothetical protein